MMVAFFSRKQKMKFSQQCTQNYSIWNQHLLSRMEAIGSVPHHSKRSLSEMSLSQRVRRIRRGLLMSSVESFDKSLREDNRKITEKQWNLDDGLFYPSNCLLMKVLKTSNCRNEQLLNKVGQIINFWVKCIILPFDPRVCFSRSL